MCSALAPKVAVLVAAGAVLSAAAPDMTTLGRATRVPCEARALVRAMEDVPDGGRLTLTAKCVYTLTAPYGSTFDGLPPVTGHVTLRGNGATITRAPGAPPFRIAEVMDTGTLVADGLTLSGGHAPKSRGGALYSAGEASLTGVTVRGNTAGEEGGGIHAAKGTLTLDSVRVLGNGVEATGFAVGGGIAVGHTATAVLHRSEVSGNTVRGGDVAGGGIASTGTLRLTSTAVRGNTADGPGAVGGGVAVSAVNGPPSLTLYGSTVTGNAALGAGARGGGIAAGPGSRVVLDASTVTGNAAAAAPGGILADGAEVSSQGTAVTANSPTNCAGGGAAVADCVE